MITGLQKCLKNLHLYFEILHSEDKAIPLQAWTRPEGSRSLRLADFKTICT